MTGDDIKTIRQQLGLTQAELANRINAIDPNLRIAATSVSRWESGKHAPSPHVAAALTILQQRGTTTRPGAAPLRASDHLELAADGFEEMGSVVLARELRRLAGAQRETGNDPIQITEDAMLPH